MKLSVAVRRTVLRIEVNEHCCLGFGVIYCFTRVRDNVYSYTSAFYCTPNTRIVSYVLGLCAAGEVEIFVNVYIENFLMNRG